MGGFFDKVKKVFATQGFKKTIKVIKYFCIGLLSFILIFAIGLRIYFESNKTEIVAKINTQINENILGEAKIGDIEYLFLLGFPDFTLGINDVEIRDNSWHIHKRSFLKAKKIEVRLNVLKLLKNEVSIHKIIIHDATIDMFKDKNGNVNSDIFKPKKSKTTSDKSSTTASIDEVDFKNVTFISENQKGKKLFHFDVESLKCNVDFDSGNWKTDVKLKVFAKSMSFNVERGSFIKNKLVQGGLAVDFSKAQNKITIVTKDFEIGEDDFNITAHFNVGKDNALFDLDIKTKILWKSASDLLANNISSKLNKFDLQIPLQARCTIKGDMNAEGDPEIIVDAIIKDDELTTSYGVVKKCSFNGRYTNNFKQGEAYTDANSAVIVKNFNGELNEIPIAIPLGIINNFDKPVATGKFNSEFDAVKLKNTINEKFIKFSEGTAKVNLDFKVDIVDLRLNKPRFTGSINIDNTSFYYKPKNINFQKTDVDLHFTEEALLIKKIRLQNDKSTVLMEGRVDNFLNLYYDAPEKMNVYWKVYSPYLDIKQIIRVLSYHDKSAAVKTKPKTKSSSQSSTSDQLQEVFSKSKVSLDFKVDKMTFNRMTGNDFKVNIELVNGGLYVKNGSMQGGAGSAISFEAQMVPKDELLLFKSNIKLSDGVISNFLASFNNFGVKSFSPNNIKGRLSFTAALSGAFNAERDLMQKSVAGNFNFQVENGALIDFEPIQKIGRIAFPNRNLKYITFSTLNGVTTIKGDLITVKEFKVTSNVLNMDVNGVYSLSNKGTSLGVRIPLRNPKDDHKITDPKEREAVRYKGIVLNLKVVDGKNGKTKIKLGKNKQVTEK
ncbi:MAG TPA: AsmA family protein [Flavobacterium sp.]